MTEDQKLVTLKMSQDELDALNRYLDENNLGNRSDFIRKAVFRQIGVSDSGRTHADGIYVRLNPVLLMALENMVKDGTIFDEESYIRQLVEKDIVSTELLNDSKTRAFKSAQSSNRNA